MNPPPRLARTHPGDPLAWVLRGHFLESVHTGHMLVLDGERSAGRRGSRRSERLSIGNPDGPVLPRSSLKPLQAVAMLRAGVELDDRQLALACGSHAGTPEHVEVARSILASVGLTEAALQNTPDWPVDGAARAAVVRAGGQPTSLTQNCSGKHAAMLATCVAAGWDTADYRSPTHPLQRLIGDVVAEMADHGRPGTEVDGCGAPALVTTLRGLARGLTRIADGAPGTAEHRVATAMRTYPEMVAGEGRTDTEAMRSVPALIVKGGAEGVLAAALPGGRAIVAKVADGSARPVPVLLAMGLQALGETGELEWARVPVLGHGEPVGLVMPAFEV